METVTLTRFCQQASNFFSNVEQGQAYVIIRRGKPIAEIIPYAGNPVDTPSWKRPGLRLKIEGANFSGAILKERAESL